MSPSLGSGEYLAWVAPGLVIERLDRFTGRVTCDSCNASADFTREDGGPLGDASLGDAWVGFVCPCRQGGDRG